MGKPVHGIRLEKYEMSLYKLLKWVNMDTDLGPELIGLRFGTCSNSGIF